MVWYFLNNDYMFIIVLENVYVVSFIYLFNVNKCRIMEKYWYKYMYN